MCSKYFKHRLLIRLIGTRYRRDVGRYILPPSTATVHHYRQVDGIRETNETVSQKQLYAFCNILARNGLTNKRATQNNLQSIINQIKMRIALTMTEFNAYKLYS